ncbi:RhoGAP-domain-containing protein [Auriscalpium vulgare]|uniref:RhoGAP-domain-containing protein n=1 Tax=Auriscalpium vulgare TaxID=40419 RepID=A0ACB8RXS3_9AGAM|nr:RhoGAP-domain-containing protein [Auriscalpium vulgare]
MSLNMHEDPAPPTVYEPYDSHELGSPTAASYSSHAIQSSPSQTVPPSASNLSNAHTPSRPSISSRTSSSPRQSSVDLDLVGRASTSRWWDSLTAATPKSDVMSVPSETITVVEPSFDENVLRALCDLDCGVPLLLDRIKQSMVSCREASVFFKKRAVLEEEFGRGMQKLAKNTSEVYSMNDGKAGSFVAAWQSTMKIHEIMADNRIRFAQRLNEMSEELANLAKEVDKNRKTTKDLATRYERNLQESEMITEKAKTRFDLSAEELERILLQKEGESLKDTGLQPRAPAGGKRAIGKAVAKGGLLLKGKNPGNIQRQEDDIRSRVSVSSDAYRKAVTETQSIRQEYFNFQLPRILRSLKECADEIDLGTQYHLTRYAFLYESIMLSDGSTLAPAGIEDGPGLKATIESIDNRSDFKVYMQNYAYAHGGVQRGPRRTGPEHEGFLPPLPQHVDRTQASPVVPTPNNGYIALPERGRPTFGVALGEQMQRDNAEIPPIMVKCCEAIEKYGLYSVGIYRISGTMSKVAKLKERLEKDLDSVNLDADEWATDINNVTSVLKLWLRELPEPLLTHELHQGFLDAAKIENDRLRHIRVHERVNDLPDANYATLKYFMGHLHKITQFESENSMSIGNLSIVFGPTLFSQNLGNGANGQNGQPVMQEATAQNKAIETILEHYTDIFIDEAEGS